MEKAAKQNDYSHGHFIYDVCRGVHVSQNDYGGLKPDSRKQLAKKFKGSIGFFKPIEPFLIAFYCVKNGNLHFSYIIPVLKDLVFC